jgi:VanZ family protein
MPVHSGHAFRVASLLATFLVMGAIVFQSAQSRDAPGVLVLTTNEAYAGHFAMYALMTFSALAALGCRGLPLLMAVLVLTAGFGVALEAYQALIPTRTATAADAIANASGAAFGAVAYVAFTAGARLLERPSPTRP